jgi:hypothetical protein
LQNSRTAEAEKKAQPGRLREIHQRRRVEETKPWSFMGSNPIRSVRFALSALALCDARKILCDAASMF